LPEPGIYQIFSELTPDNGNMLCREKLLKVSYPAGNRVTAPYRARVTVTEKTLLIETFESARHTRDGDVNQPRQLVWIQDTATPRLNTDTNARGLFPQPLQQRRKQLGTHMICHSQPKHTRAARRLETVPRQEPPHALKRIF